MKCKVHALVNAFFIIFLSLFSANVKASFWMKCEGMVTINSIIPEKETLSLSVKSKHIKADIQVHNHTFTCTGHAKEIGSYGERKNVAIVLPSIINKKWLKKGTNLQVNLDYANWAGPLPSGGGSSTMWTALKTIETIPPKKILTKPSSEGKGGFKKGAPPEEPTVRDKLNSADSVEHAEEIKLDTKAAANKQELEIAEAKARRQVEIAEARAKRQVKIEQQRLELEEPTSEEKLNFADSVDTDGDGVSNRYDVCRSVANPNQDDKDNDRIGDACDSCPSDPAPRYRNGCPKGILLKLENKKLGAE